MNNPNPRPNRSRPVLTPEQERRRAEWQRYAAEQAARKREAAAAHRRAEAKRARQAEAEKKRRRAEAWRLFCNRFVVYLITLALMLVLGGMFFVLSLYRTDTDKLPREYRYLFGGSYDEAGEVMEEPLVCTLSGKEAVQEGVVYLPMSTLAEFAGMTVTGTPDVLKYTAPSGEYVRFTSGSSRAEVNGDVILLDGKAVVRAENGDETMWIPADFVESWMQGVTLTRDAEAAEMHLTLNGDPLGFSLKGSYALPGIDEKAEFGNTPAIAFKADLSAYEQYMNPADRDAYVTLINVSHKLASDYIPADLTNVADTRKDGRNTQQLREYAAKALEAMFIEMRACGITDVSVTSAYRSYSYQSQLFEQRVAMYPSLSRAEAEAKAATVVTYPGSSEHQSGLCVDMHNLPSADISFGNTSAFAWISANAHKFGFILRYPEDKVHETGISYEPWHYRYVGRYHATRIYTMGLCLEEYVAEYLQ